MDIANYTTTVNPIVSRENMRLMCDILELLECRKNNASPNSNKEPKMILIVNTPSLKRGEQDDVDR